MKNDVNLVSIKTPFLCLGQLLKLEKVISTGGEVKSFLSAHKVVVNNVLESRRGRKLFPNDEIVIDDKTTFRVVNL